MDIFDFYKQFKKVKKNAVKDVLEIVINAEHFIIFLQKKQLEKGINNDGNQIGVYAYSTEAIARNPLKFGVQKPIKPKITGNPYNFQWTGDFFKGIFIVAEINNNSIDIITDSTVEYIDKLESKYKKLLGLIEKNRDEFNEFLKLKTVEILNKKINL